MTRGLRASVRALLVVALLFGSSPSYSRPGCNNAQIFGASLIRSICWSCVLPIRIAGFGGGDNDPPGANRNPVCSCPDDLGVPQPGFTVGAWLPYRLFEVVRNPYCMPALNGVFLQDDWVRLGVRRSVTDGVSTQQGDAMHVHVYSFPLATMMELITAKECNPGGYHDMDIIMMSEFDPTSQDDMLALFIYFETALFANPVALAACSLECGSVSAGIKPSSAQVWFCAGCWGSLYPLTNNGFHQSLHTSSSLFSARTLAVKHRRGLGHKTYGTDALCGGTLSVFLPKEQYRWQQVFPVPQARKPCCHWTGVSEFVTGGASRFRPYVGEDAIQLLFRYVDCCSH